MAVRFRYHVPQTDLDPPNPPEPGQEVRGLWVSRFDWTTGARPAEPARIDEIVANAAAAGFNMILFQVRGVADAFYVSGLEPWAQRVSGGVLGQPPEPLWDPLDYFVERAHEAGLQLHAYINVYPVAEGGVRCAEMPSWEITPMPLYYQLAAAHGLTKGKPNAMQWTAAGEVFCGSYRYASPASSYLEDHLLWVVQDLAERYAIDGIHLDHVRYGARRSSCDPVSLRRYHDLPDGADLPPCMWDEAYADWQRHQVSNLVHRIYQEVISAPGHLWLSAAVWPVHARSPQLNLPGTPAQGYHDYYQDAKGWVQGGYIDALMPMIYPAVFHCPDKSYFTQAVWSTLVADFQAHRAGRYIVPGIGARYCTFDEIETRIDMARSLGAAGHALFSYRGLQEKGYFEALAAGPYLHSAAVPRLSWRFESQSTPF